MIMIVLFVLTVSRIKWNEIFSVKLKKFTKFSKSEINSSEVDEWIKLIRINNY